MADETQSRRRPAFASFSRVVSQSAGQPAAFVAAMLIVIVWATTGPLFHFSDTWQLVINTGTTVVTFLMVFLIQNTQNRDATAMHLKLDELIRATQGARNVALDTEELPEKELEHLRAQYESLAVRARQRAEELVRTGSPDLETAAEDATAAIPDGMEAHAVDSIARAGRTPSGHRREWLHEREE